MNDAICRRAVYKGCTGIMYMTSFRNLFNNILSYTTLVKYIATAINSKQWVLNEQHLSFENVLIILVPEI